MGKPLPKPGFYCRAREPSSKASCRPPQNRSRKSSRNAKPGTANCEPKTASCELFGGGSGIRTHGPLRVSGFQDRCIKPLCHPSRICSEALLRSVRAELCHLRGGSQREASTGAVDEGITQVIPGVLTLIRCFERSSPKPPSLPPHRGTAADYNRGWHPWSVPRLRGRW
jgi:hypothetical protein